MYKDQIQAASGRPGNTRSFARFGGWALYYLRRANQLNWIKVRCHQSVWHPWSPGIVSPPKVSCVGRWGIWLELESESGHVFVVYELVADNYRPISPVYYIKDTRATCSTQERPKSSGLNLARGG